jgi:hypothetical protein
MHHSDSDDDNQSHDYMSLISLYSSLGECSCTFEFYKKNVLDSASKVFPVVKFAWASVE